MSELMCKIKPYQRWLMLIPLLLSGLWFFLLERIVIHPDYLLHTRLDDFIPFIPLFVIPYVLWYAYVAVPAFFLFWKSPRCFVKMASFLALGMLIACVIFTLFPNGQALRPAMAAGRDDLLILLIRFLYFADTPANSAPSIHVVYSVAAHAAICRYSGGLRWTRQINAASLVLAALCILSTVFIKQHSVIDLIAGLLLSALLYRLIYGRREYREERRAVLVGA